MNQLLSVQYLNDVYKSYPEYVTQQDMREICQVGENFAYKLNKSKTIPYVLDYKKPGRCYRIRKTDILVYLYQHDSIFYLDHNLNQLLRKFFSNLLKNQPDVLRVIQVKNIFGFSTSMIYHRIFLKHIQAIRVYENWYIPQNFLLDFLVSKNCLSLAHKPVMYKMLLDEFRLKYNLFLINNSERR